MSNTKIKENNKDKFQLQLDFERKSFSFNRNCGYSIPISKIDFSTVRYAAPINFSQLTSKNSIGNCNSYLSAAVRSERSDTINAKIIDMMEYRRKSIIDYVLNHTKSF